VIRQTVIIIEESPSYQLSIEFCPAFFFSVGSIIISLLPTKLSTFTKYYRKKWEYNGTVHQLFIDFKKAHNSVKREVLYNILLEFGIPKKLVRQIKMCLNEI